METNQIPGGMTAEQWGNMTLRQQMDVMVADYEALKILISAADARCAELRREYESKCHAADAISDKGARAAARRAATDSRASLDAAVDEAIGHNDNLRSIEHAIIMTKANIISGVIFEAECRLGEEGVIELGEYWRAFRYAIEDGDSVRVLECARGLSREVADAERRARTEGDTMNCNGLDGDGHFAASRALALADALIYELFKV